MTRLTKKHKNLYIKNDDLFEHDIIQKLGKLEDLEEQLGCPLEVMFKALDEGIIINEEGYVNSAYDNKEFNEKEDSYYIDKANIVIYNASTKENLHNSLKDIFDKE